MKIRKRLKCALVVLGGSCVSLAAAGAASADISMPMVPVGNPGNPADTTAFGSVSYSYNIGEYDVTAGEYTAFLNAVAAADPYGLYNSDMSAVLNNGEGNGACGITQQGSSGSYTYVTTRNPNYPVNNVSWGDAARFCNWLTNGQPTGAEGNGTTETGSYTLNGATSDVSLDAVTRNANADYVIPTENEWYKAAYYNPLTESYYLYATQSNDQPSNVLSATGTNNANYYDGGYTDPTNILTPVGAFADSPSPYGTYDQNGDVFQWNESVFAPFTVPFDFPGGRGNRGGSAGSTFPELQSSLGEATAATLENPGYGFRIAQVPEPASVGLLGFAIIGILPRRSTR